MDRDSVEPDRVTVVRTGPDPDRLRAAEPFLRCGEDGRILPPTSV